MDLARGDRRGARGDRGAARRGAGAVAADRRLGRAWVALTLALAVHAVDEAVNDFLSVYNPAARAIRARLGTAFPPPLEFGEWVAGLILVVLVLLALSTLAFSGERAAVWLAFPYAALMFANGMAHIVLSILTGSLLPGTWSAPLLLVASAWLFVVALRTRLMVRRSANPRRTGSI